MTVDLRSWAHDAQRSLLVVAHRGASADFPENTTAAFDAALGAPIHGIELDLQLSRDGVPVIYHDRTLEKVGAGRARVAGTDLADLRKLRFRGERILTLDQTLDGYGRSTCLLLEIKARESAAVNRRLVEGTVAALRARGLERDVLLLCFDADVLAFARELAPLLATVQNFRRPPGNGTDALFALSIDVRSLTPGAVRRAHERGQPVLTYTCNTPRAVLGALEAGVDGIMSDRPAWLAEFLAARRS